MKISKWLDKKQEEGADMTQIELPIGMLIDEEPDKTLYYKEINSCGFFCAKNHPFSKVEKYGSWYYCKGQDKKAGIHSSEMKWKLFTKDKAVALQTAAEHIE